MSSLIFADIVYSQQAPIVITADQPNVWTLEQAHYLLAQMHRRNLDLKAKGLTELDANAINGVRLDILKTLLEVGVEFSQEDLFNNRQAKKNITFNNTRRQELIKRNDELQNKSLQITEDIALLNSKLKKAQTEEEKAAINADIEQKTIVQAKVDKMIEFNRNELKDLTPSDSKVSETTSDADFEKDKQGGILDESFKAAAKKIIENADNPPQLNASLQLDNFLQLQYEIISKQLTLLRDEVGPGERLLFLELPQSIKASYDKADNKWAQSWWKVLGYTKAEKECKDDRNVTKECGIENNRDLISTSETIDSILSGTGVKNKDSLTQTSTFVPLSNQVKSAVLNNIAITPQQVRTVELIPRQSSLNVNDIKLRNKAGVLNIVASFLFGLGANINYQRQQEQYSQFVQQELYSSAFGKGSREFGWTFTPMPGTNRLASGVRTTYAIVVVPKEANSIILSSKGCYFRRSDSQPQDFDRANYLTNVNSGCSAEKNFIIPIAGGGNDSNNDFFIKGLTYQPAKKNNRIVVSIYGKNFSSQIGVLINGVPLKPSLGLAQPFIRDDSNTKTAVDTDLANEKIKGSFERIDSNQILAAFEIPDFEGTPVITLIAPGIAIDINRLDNLYINNVNNTCLEKVKNCSVPSEFMFGKRPSSTAPLKIENVEFYKHKDNILKAFVYGEGFTNACNQVYFNGSQYSTFPVVNPTVAVTPNYLNKGLLEIPTFTAPTDSETIQTTLICGSDILKTPVVKNPVYNSPTIANVQTPIYDPLRLKINSINFVSYEDSVLVVEIDGIGFTENLKPSVGELVYQSPNKFSLIIPDFKVSQVVTFTDANNRLFVKVIVNRPPSEKPSEVSIKPSR